MKQLTSKFDYVLNKLKLNDLNKIYRQIKALNIYVIFLQLFSIPFLFSYLIINSNSNINFQHSIIMASISFFSIFLIISELLNILNFILIYKFKNTTNQKLYISCFISIFIPIFIPFVNWYFCIQLLKNKNTTV